ncbi:MFS transporter [Pseudaestuariivita rosea]|uniref:MFS transporter n=1 Tax=Pseudaestuariivita rosea TaxID=2763263 RepID=UPI001F223D9B|nr:MFS transporter [Pseudaestuariivita rosea]
MSDNPASRLVHADDEIVDAEWIVSDASAHDLTTRQRRMSLAAVMIHMLGIGLTLGITFPLVSLTFASWGAPDWQVGLSSAMAPLAVLLLMPFLPQVARKLGAIKAMFLGCAIGGLALLSMYLFPSVAVWIAARFVVGTGLALPWLVGDVWVNSVAKETSRGRVIAGYVICLFAGFAAGPIMLETVGIEGFTPFGVALGALGLAVIPFLFVAKHAPTIDVHENSGIWSAAKTAPAIAVAAFAAGFTEACIFALLPNWGLATGLAETAALRLLTVCVIGGIIIQLCLGALADVVDRTLGLAVIGLCLFGLSFSMHFAVGSLVYIFAFGIGGFVLTLYGLSLTLLGQVFRRDELAMASAAFLILYQIGSATGPVTTGAAMDVIGAEAFLAVLAASGLVVFTSAILTWAKANQ